MDIQWRFFFFDASQEFCGRLQQENVGGSNKIPILYYHYLSLQYRRPFTGALFNFMEIDCN